MLAIRVLTDVHSAHSELIQIETTKFKFSVIKHGDELLMTSNQGLGLIGVDINWIASLGKRKQILTKRGFSFKETLVGYQYEFANGNKVFFCEAYSWSDWIIIWGYFAPRGNFRAVSLLSIFAEKSLQHYLWKKGC
jgi:hypothetical protein